MSIRTIDDLSNRLDTELAWRKKELSNLKCLIDQAENNNGRSRVLGRCGITMLYAHWEGFVKLASQFFLEYVAMQRLRNEQLQPNLLALSLCSSISFSPESRKYSEYGKIAEFFKNELSKRARLPYKKGLDTNSNLSSTVLKEITWCLGIDYSEFQIKEKFIDSHLLARRNHIAHGEELNIDPKEFDEMRNIVVEMMMHLKIELENSAAIGSYIKH